MSRDQAIARAKTGLAANPQGKDILRRVAKRAERLGIQRLVLGSGGARKRPDGVTETQAFEHIAEFGHSVSVQPGYTEVVEFELAVAFDVQGVQLPRRQIIRNSCPWKYRGDGCGYAGGPVADANDNPTTDAARDVCGKRLTSCKMRFGVAGWPPFGAFPGSSAYR